MTFSSCAVAVPSETSPGELPFGAAPASDDEEEPAEGEDYAPTWEPDESALVEE